MIELVLRTGERGRTLVPAVLLVLNLFSTRPDSLGAEEVPHRQPNPPVHIGRTSEVKPPSVGVEPQNSWWFPPALLATVILLIVLAGIAVKARADLAGYARTLEIKVAEPNPAQTNRAGGFQQHHASSSEL